MFIGQTANDCPPDPTHDGPNRSADNGTAYGTGGSASRGPSGLSVGGKRKCKESKGGESREEGTNWLMDGLGKALDSLPSLA